MPLTCGTYDRTGCELLATVLRAGSRMQLRVNGTSMLPSIWPGDVLTIQGMCGTVPKKGQIVLFQRDGRLFVHRMTGWTDVEGTRYIVTRGDSHSQCDPPVQLKDLLGTVETIVRDGWSVATSVREVSIPLKLIAFAMRHSTHVRQLVLRIDVVRRWIRFTPSWRNGSLLPQGERQDEGKKGRSTLLDSLTLALSRRERELRRRSPSVSQRTILES